jgi:3-deoxy-D-manno-octulosonic-acid transferase
MELETALNTLSDEADRLVSAAQAPGPAFDLLGQLMFGAYNIALAIASPVVLGILLAKQRCRRGLVQRLGFLPQTMVENRREGHTIWVHAVSMGEVNAVVPLVQQLKARDPHCHVIVSTVTETGKEAVTRRLEGLAQHLYFPLDFPFSVRKVMATIRPSVILIVETELWPNFLKMAAIRGVPCVLVNGRLSTDSFAGYMKLRPFFSRIMKCFSLCLMQSDRDVERVVALGADPERVVRIGNLKFDQKPFMRSAHPIGVGLAPHEELFVAGSTHLQEEEAVLACYRQLLDVAPGLVLLLAPRHIERAQALETTIRARGFAVVRRTSLDQQPGTVKGPRVILLDTRGELAALYTQAAIVFVGGSLVPIGGHSPLEPASAGKAVLFGPYMDHFAEVAELLVSQGGAIQIQDSQEMAAALGALLKDRARLAQMGRAGQEIVRSHQGTVARTTELIAELLKRPPRSA